MRTITLPAREIPIAGEYDVIVAGGGPGGIPAAVAAARAGAKTLLIERYGYLGGMATAGLINVILGVQASGTDEPMIGGIAEELCREMSAVGGAPKFEDAVERGGINFDPEAFKLVSDALVLGSGVDLLLHSWSVDTVVEDGRIAALVLEGKSGRCAVTGRVFVDATGDADLVWQSGAGFTHGREFDGAVQAMGSMFRFGGADEERLPTGEERAAIIERGWAAMDAGEINVFNPSWGDMVAEKIAGEHMVNAMRFPGDATSVEDLTRAEVQLRRDTWDLIDWWQRNVPGLENAYLIQSPPHVGIRESRQMIGLERISGQDVLDARRHDEVIARGCYYIDIHCPLGRVKNATHMCYKNCPNDPPCAYYEECYDELPGRDADAHLPMRPRDGLSQQEWDRPRAKPRDGLWFDIPWGCLVSADIPNLLCAGRAISCDHHGMAAVRVIGTCMAIGQAAGEGAAMAADDPARDASSISVSALQKRLRETGAAI